MHVCGMTILEELGLNIRNIASGANPEPRFIESTTLAGGSMTNLQFRAQTLFELLGQPRPTTMRLQIGQPL